MNIHVTNLGSNIIENDLYKMFARYGEVAAVELVRDKLNNRSRGRAFVDMPLQAAAESAILQLHRTDCKGKIISVVEVGYNPSPDAWTFEAFAPSSAQHKGQNSQKNSLL